MANVYLDSQNRLHREATTAECPHCGAIAHQTVQAHPDFARLRAVRPPQMGLILTCDACHTPIFLRYRVKAWHDDRVEFHAAPIEVERVPERFNYSHLPETVATHFREALACYSAGLLQAFAVMCRLATQAMLDDLGERSRLRIFDQVAEVRMLASLDDETFAAIRTVLFEGDANRAPPQLTRMQAAVLVETMKDLLYQSYVRRAKLQQALRMRQFFAEPNAQRTG